MAQTDSVSLPDIPATPAAFKTWKDCLKELRKEPSPLPEEKRQEFAARIEQCREAKLIAFECLSWLRHSKDAAKFRWLDEPMQRVLGGGVQPPNLALLENPMRVGAWVAEQIKTLDTLSAWNAFFGSGRHLWLLHCLFQCRDKRESLVEGLTALANGLAHWQNLRSPALWKKGGVQTTDPRWIAQLLEARLPAKFEMPKAFIEAAYSVSAVAELSSSSRFELNALWKQLDAVRAERDEESTARIEAQAREHRLRQDLKQNHDELASCRLELEEEKKHTVRSEGFSEVARKQTVQQVLSDVRQVLNHRLEDIRNYADRDKPNGEEILELVQEIKVHLAKLESRLLP